MCHLKGMNHKMLALGNFANLCHQGGKEQSSLLYICTEFHRSRFLQDLTVSHWQVLLLISSFVVIKLLF